MNSSLIERIKKLLSLAQSDNANERDAALAKAAALAAEHDVDMSLLDLSDVGRVKEEEMLEDETLVGRRLDPRTKFVTVIVRDFCKVEAVYGHNSGHRTVCFLGRKSDVSYAKWLFAYLNEEYMRRWNMERKLHGLPGSHRNTFFLGMKNGQHARMQEEQDNAEQAAIARHAGVAAVEGVAPVAAVTAQRVADLSQRYQLVKLDESKLRKKFMTDKYPTLRSISTRVSVRSHDTYSSGMAHGRSMSMARPLQG